MNFEKIEQAYTYPLENTQSIQNELSTNFYDALIEQNAMYLDGKTDLDIVKNNSKKYFWIFRSRLRKCIK